jgi:microcystin-dependent protein
MSEPFIAEIRIFTYNFAPRGWAYCDGQLLPIAQNTALFSLIGTTYGGDGRSTLGLPDLRDRVPMHPGRGPGLTSRRLGEKAGIMAASLTEAQIPSHKHEMAVTQNPATTTNPTGLYPSKHKDDRKGFMYKENPTLNAQFSSAAIATAGGSQEHLNMQPYLTLSFCIALTGLYPSRS